MGNQAAQQASSTLSQWIASAAAVALTLVIAILILLQARRVIDRVPVVIDSAQPDLQVGVTAHFRSGDKLHHVQLESLNLTLSPGQLPQPNLPAGKWSGEFDITFQPGRVRYARIGARLRGGSVIIMRNNDVVLSDYSGDEERIVLSNQLLALGFGLQQLKYIFTCDERFDVRLEAMWQPEDKDAPRPLP